MKNLVIIFLAVTIMTPNQVWAETASSRRSSIPHPCKTVKQTCEAAGFYKGGRGKGKSLLRDCFKPLVAGRSVAGVSLDQDTVQACHAKRLAKQRKLQEQ